uniref:RNA-directed DNA polymerase, eukaryota n=1 Tax=Tanacetum cinerariifolium TaxID=118510 RepID=A0A6L2P4H9_TANCI|nr:RNA-directed DNA polymerase, eukaryota [Tanacetum cinerariifolium]
MHRRRPMKVKDVSSISNLRTLIMEEGFFVVNLVYLGGILLNVWSRETFTRIGKKWGEALDIEDNVDSSFGRKRLCIKSKLPLSILESFKVIFKGKVYMVRARELFTWSLIFLGQKEMEYTSDEESDVGPQKVPDRSQNWNKGVFCEGSNFFLTLVADLETKDALVMSFIDDNTDSHVALEKSSFNLEQNLNTRHVLIKPGGSWYLRPTPVLCSLRRRGKDGKAIDMQALAKLILDCLTCHKQYDNLPIGNEDAVFHHKWADLKKENGVAYDLISLFLQNLDSLDYSEVYLHPFFLTWAQHLDFLQDMSE